MRTDAERDPRDRGPKPPAPPQQQEYPGTESELRPKADHGEESYEGHGLLKDRRALITGGDSGIGRAVAIAFAREGADVAFSYVPNAEEEDANTTEELIRNAGRKAFSYGVDLATAEACRSLVRETVEGFGGIDILVNNAAFQGKSVERFEDLDPERVEQAYRVNILAMFHITREALPHMKEGAVIINTASIQAFDPSPGILDYATTKAAIVALTKGLSKELIQRGIRVNAVAPGPVWTPLIPQSFGAEKVENFGKNNPMERAAQPAELAPSFVFLASDAAQFITGETLAVTGGRRIQ